MQFQKLVGRFGPGVLVWGVLSFIWSVPWGSSLLLLLAFGGWFFLRRHRRAWLAASLFAVLSVPLLKLPVEWRYGVFLTIILFSGHLAWAIRPEREEELPFGSAENKASPEHSWAQILSVAVIGIMVVLFFGGLVRYGNPLWGAIRPSGHLLPALLVPVWILSSRLKGLPGPRGGPVRWDTLFMTTTVPLFIAVGLFFGWRGAGITPEDRASLNMRMANEVANLVLQEADRDTLRAVDRKMELELQADPANGPLWLYRAFLAEIMQDSPFWRMWYRKAGETLTMEDANLMNLLNPRFAREAIGRLLEEGRESAAKWIALRAIEQFPEDPGLEYLKTETFLGGPFASDETWALIEVLPEGTRRNELAGLFKELRGEWESAFDQYLAAVSATPEFLGAWEGLQRLFVQKPSLASDAEVARVQERLEALAPTFTTGQSIARLARLLGFSTDHPVQKGRSLPRIRIRKGEILRLELAIEFMDDTVLKLDGLRLRRRRSGWSNLSVAPEEPVSGSWGMVRKADLAVPLRGDIQAALYDAEVRFLLEGTEDGVRSATSAWVPLAEIQVYSQPEEVEVSRERIRKNLGEISFLDWGQRVEIGPDESVRLSAPESHAATGLVLVSALAHSAECPQGKPVSELIIRAEGRIVHRGILRAGLDTADIFSESPGRSSGRGSASSWLSYPLERGNESFNAHWYYSQWFFPKPLRVEELEVRVLGDESGFLHLFHVLSVRENG